MKVTTYSEKPYYPVILSNGADTALVDYSGSMFTGDPSHARYSNNQGTPSGWYKMSHRPTSNYLTPLAQSGYYLTFNGLKTEPMFYEQEFDAKKAILTTLTRSRGIECRITTFMAAKSLMVEHYEILGVPAGVEVGVIFRVQPPRCCFEQLSLRYAPKIRLSIVGDDRIDIEYQTEQYGVNGVGFMSLDRKAARAEADEYKGELSFEKLSPGWSVTKFLSFADNKDTLSYRALIEANIERSRKGFEFVRSAHEDDWLEYSARSSIAIPDDDLQAIYDIGVYSCRAHLHPETGGLNCGLLPHLWGGGTYCPDDANYSHVGLLRTNHPERADHHLNYYRRFREEGRRFAEKHKMPGTVCPVWGNCFGEHLGDNYDWYIFYAKMSQLGCAVQAFYWLWKYYPERAENRDNLKIMEELLDFIYAGFIADDGEEACVRECKAGDETPRKVKNDTYTTSVFSHAFSGFEEMSRALGVPLKKTFSGLGGRLLAALSKNVKDGFLLAYQDAEIKYFAPISYIYHLPDGFPSADNIRNWAKLDVVRTPWGLNSDNPCEIYRDWPWAATRLAIALAHIGDSKDAFFWLKDSCKYAAATGALPEKIRIDGYPVRYWYSSTHALFVWATTYALCHRGKDGSLRLLYGLNGDWKDLEFKNLRVFDGLAVSATVKNGNIATLKISNHALKTQGFAIDLNPSYQGPTGQITLAAGETFEFQP